MLCALCSPGCGASSQSLVNLLVATLLKKPAVLRNHQLLIGLQLGLGLVKHFPIHAQSGPAWSHAVSFRDPSPGSLQAQQSCHVPKTLLHSSSAQPPALTVFLSPTLERVPDRSGGGDGQDVVGETWKYFSWQSSSHKGGVCHQCGTIILLQATFCVAFLLPNESS